MAKTLSNPRFAREGDKRFIPLCPDATIGRDKALVFIGDERPDAGQCVGVGTCPFQSCQGGPLKLKFEQDGNRDGRRTEPLLRFQEPGRGGLRRAIDPSRE
ncbi:MAG: hypothetical protein MZV64_71460 [Ignavibacteriales bacterium]|nr:hypothetical protein [Ignavibacteriales bacterium]